MNNRICVLFITLFCSLPSLAQELLPLDGKPGISFRGLSVVHNDLLWVSGTKGTVGRSTNGGKTFHWMTVKGFEKRDFRDIEAFDVATAVIMAVDSPGIILRTHDGGYSWVEVYRNNHSGIFLDAMHFYNKKEGIVVGDPIEGHFILLRTEDQGRRWREIPKEQRPPADSGEACFAASGSNIKLLNKRNFALVSGGMKSRIWLKNSWSTLPLAQGSSTEGANSIAIRKSLFGTRIVVVGGNFSNDSSRIGNASLSKNDGKSWTTPEVAPWGYKSSVDFISSKKLIACGTSGVDVSKNGGKSWKRISTTGYHVVQRAKEGQAVYFAGGNGRLAKLK